jgi:hypothetical protein
MSDRYEIIKKQLESFDLDVTATERVVFLECYVNDAIPGKALVSLDHQSSVKKAIQLNRGTGTPSPWKLLAQLVWSYKPGTAGSLRDDFSSLGLSAKFGETQLLDLKETDNAIEEIACSGLSSDCTLHFFERNFGDYSALPYLEDSDLVGFVYVLFNELQPEICKIGYTDREPRVRAAELSIELGLNVPYQIALAVVCRDAESVEQDLHQRLESIRVSKEYFQRDFEALKGAFASILYDRADELPCSEREREANCLVAYQNDLRLFKERSIYKEIFASHSGALYQAKLAEINKAYVELSELYQEHFWRSFGSLFVGTVEQEWQAKFSELRSGVSEASHDLDLVLRELESSRPNLDKRLIGALLEPFPFLQHDWAWKDWNSVFPKKKRCEDRVSSCQRELQKFSDGKQVWMRRRTRELALDLLKKYLDTDDDSYLTVAGVKRHSGEKVGFLISVKTYDQRYQLCLLGLYLLPQKCVSERKAPKQVRITCIPLAADRFRVVWRRDYVNEFLPYQASELVIEEFSEIGSVGAYLWKLLDRGEVFFDKGYLGNIVQPMCVPYRVDLGKVSIGDFFK